MYEDKKNSISAVLRTGLSCLPHLHSHIEVGYLIKGETKLTLDREEFFLKSGDAFMIFPNRIHSFEDSGDISCYLLICSAEDASPFTDILKQKLPLCPVARPQSAAAEQVFALAAKQGRSLELCPDAPFAAERVRAYAPAVISEILPDFKLTDSALSGQDTATQRILLYCDTYYREELSLDLLSEKLGYSRYYISHVFTDNVKMGFSHYLRSLRVTAAKRMIRHSNLSMTQIAIESGFSSIRTFNRQFFEETGLTPTEYAKKRRTN